VLLLVRCVHGTEWVAAAELADVLGVAGRLARREVLAALPGPDPRLLGLACADDAFAVVGEVPAADPTKAGLAPLAAAVAALDWSAALADVLALRDAPPVAFDCVASVEGRRSHDRVAAEDAVGAALAPVLRLPFASRSGGAAPDADLTVRVFLRPGTAVVALRVGRRPLHRRDWKRDTGPGTLHPPLAAALAAIAGAGPGTAVLDPFCGDGTLAVEAARRGAAVRAADLDPVRVAAARANAARAAAAVAVEVGDAADLAGLDAVDLLLANPPWSRAVAPGGRLAAAPGAYWAAAGAVLRGRAAVVVDAELDVPGVLERAGWAVGFATRVRLAGRLAHLVLAAAPGRPAPVLPPGPAAWRDRALAAGVVTADGF
jgi:23S rRNA G2445 N2-methylase RlmL